MHPPGSDQGCLSPVKCRWRSPGGGGFPLSQGLGDVISVSIDTSMVAELTDRLLECNTDYGLLQLRLGHAVQFYLLVL